MILGRRFTHAVALLGVLALAACEKEPPPNPDPLTPSTLSAKQREVIEYFKLIALGAEFGDLPNETFRWTNDANIRLRGSGVTPLHLAMADTVVATVNRLATNGFRMSRDSSQRANLEVYICSTEEIIRRFPSQAEVAKSNYGFFYVNASRITISSAYVWIDSEIADTNIVKSMVLEELTQPLGLMRDSGRYPASIFYETESEGGFATEYAPVDLELIRLLYHPLMEGGLDDRRTEVRLTQILENE